MKLELKHITPYLPYKLMILDTIKESKKVMNLGQGTSNNWVGVKTVLNYSDSAYKDGRAGLYKPILRPLKEYKEIEEVEIEFSQSSMQKFDDIFFLNIPVLNKFDYVDYNVMLAMFKNHIDIFGLIEKGLAIDVNTLKD